MPSASSICAARPSRFEFEGVSFPSRRALAAHLAARFGRVARSYTEALESYRDPVGRPRWRRQPAGADDAAAVIGNL